MTTPSTNEDRPKSLAALKRFLKPGVEIELVFRCGPLDPPQRRSVVKTHSRAVCFRQEDGLLSWLEWKSVSCYRFTEEGFSIADNDGNPILTYRYLNGDLECPASSCGPAEAGDSQQA